MSRKSSPATVRYCGQGAYLLGLPARDMSLEEWQSYPESQRKLALELGLYDEREEVEQ